MLFLFVQYFGGLFELWGLSRHLRASLILLAVFGIFLSCGRSGMALELMSCHQRSVRSLSPLIEPWTLNAGSDQY